MCQDLLVISSARAKSLIIDFEKTNGRKQHLFMCSLLVVIYDDESELS